MWAKPVSPGGGEPAVPADGVRESYSRFLGPVVNTAFVDGSPALSHDGTALYFHSTANRPGRLGPCFGDLGPCVFDIYVTTRSGIKGRE